jgi:co-chaperonin GroES (HSP10)
MGEVKRVEGFPIKPIKDFLYVVEYGQPNRSEGGIILGNVEMIGASEDTEFGRYRMSEFRFGKVVAIGPGKPRWDKKSKREFTPEIDIELGDVVLYSRRFGSRLGKERRFKVPEYKVPLNVRVFDISQIIGVVEDFKPWWDVEESQLDPDGVMTG